MLLAQRLGIRSEAISFYVSAAIVEVYTVMNIPIA